MMPPTNKIEIALSLNSKGFQGGIAESQRALATAQGQMVASVRSTSKELSRIQVAKNVLGLASSPNTEREIDRVRAAYEKLRVSGTLSSAELAKAHVAMTEKIIAAQNSANALASKFALVREQLVKLAVAGAGIAVATKEAIQFESAMSDVRKVVDFTTPQQFKELTADIKGMSRQIPVTMVDLAKIAEAGGQMGIASQDIKGFTDVTAKMSTAFKIDAESAGKDIGKLMNIFSLTVPETRLLGDAINHLGNNTNAVERDILNVMARVGGMSKLFGLANTETAALATAFLSLGKPPEIAATAINALLLTLQSANTKDEAFKVSLQSIGFSAEQLAADVSRKPQKTLMRFLETLKDLDKQTQVETVAKLFGKEYADDIAILLTGMNKYKDALGLVGKETNYAGSMEKEFAERIKTTEAQLQLAKNALVEAGTNLGTAFLPVVVGAAKAVASLAQGIANLAEAFPTLSAAATTAATAFAGFGALRMAWAVMRSGIVGLIAPLTSLSAAALAFTVTPLGAVLTAAGVAAYAFYKATESSIPPLLENASALAKNREETVGKIKSLEALKKTLAETIPGTKEHTDAEEKLANLLPGANLSLDEQGRILAKMGSVTKDNTNALHSYLKELKQDDTNTFAMQLETQARAFATAKKETEEHTAGLKKWFAVGIDGAENFAQALLRLSYNGWFYEKYKQNGAELRRQTDDAKKGLNALLAEAQKASMSVNDLAKAMDKVRVDPAVKDQVLALYRNMAQEAEKAASKTASVAEQLKQFSIAMTGPAAMAKAQIVDAIKVTQEQTGKYNETLGKQREELKRLTDDQQKSWKAMADAAASWSKDETDRIEAVFARRQTRLDDQVAAKEISEKEMASKTVALAVEESDSKIAEARRYQREALGIVDSEYRTRIGAARRLKEDERRVDEERLQDQKSILEKTEAAYKASIDKLIAEEKRHTEEARKLAQERAAFAQSIQDKLANLAEKGMSPEAAYNDKQKRILEEQKQAQDALKKGDYDTAKSHADRMIALAEQTSDAVVDGDRTIVTAQQAVAKSMEQIKAAAEIADKAMKGQEEGHKQAAEAFRTQAASMADALDDVRARMAKLDGAIAADHKLIIRTDTKGIDNASRKIDELTAKIKALETMKTDLQADAKTVEGIPELVKQGSLDQARAGLQAVGDSFARFKEEFKNFDPDIAKGLNVEVAKSAIDGLSTKFKEMQTAFSSAPPSEIKVTADTSQADSALAKVKADADSLDGRVVTYYVQQVTQEAHATGGMVGLGAKSIADGGRLSGYGGGDTVPLLAEPGEIVVRKERSALFQPLLLAINSGSGSQIRHALADLPRFQTGGIVSSPFLPPVPRLTLGSVPSAGAQETHVLEIRSENRPPSRITTLGSRQELRRLVDHLKEAGRGVLS
ncbi:MAG: phage tail tape measure protein [Magnetococcales bacterium]|nr:phage tail tape measure protein [Magnetococcales bacterium]